MMYRPETAPESSLALSKVLSEKIKELKPGINEKYQLMNLRDDVLLVWCNATANLYSQILQGSTCGSAEGNKIQCLALSKPPIWEIHRIVINNAGTGVLLIGLEGVAVVELPKRWGNPPLYEGGVDNLTCRVEYIGEKFFMCNPSVNILSADWHPGSVDFRYVIILSSDNYIRVYNLSYLDIPEQAIPVAKSSKSIREGCRLGIDEYAVAFGIGPPLPPENYEESNKDKPCENASQNIINDVDEQRQKFKDLFWPIFILYNNGDLYCTLNSIKRTRLKRKVLYGPLSMVPASFDNYGVDFCSLLVLQTSPIVLVIGNSKGYLHHCIVIEGGVEHHQNSISDSFEDLTQSVSKLMLEVPNQLLHVYESVHLEISASEDAVKQDVSVLLIPDPNTPARYWVLHKQDVFGVSLPLVESLLLDGDEFPEKDLECHVEHLLSTQLTSHSAATNFVIGAAPSMTQPSRILVLLSSGLINAVPLPSLFISSFSGNAPGREHSSSRNKREPFEDHIRSILKPSSSQPLLISGSNPEIDPRELLSVTITAVDTLRKNYLQPQLKAREAIRRRRNLLVEQKEHLSRELGSLEEEENGLLTKAHELTQKFEVSNERQAKIMKRLEFIFGNLITKLPILSSSEEAMLKELHEMTEKTKTLAMELTQIQSKNQWQQKRLESRWRNEAVKTSLSRNQIECLKISLSKESGKISEILESTKQLKKELGL